MCVLGSRDGLSEQMMDAQHLLCCGEDQMREDPEDRPEGWDEGGAE